MRLSKNEIVSRVVLQVKRQTFGESTGHDWYHIERVWKNARLIAQEEKANVFIVELAALLHDIADHKFVENFEEETVKRTSEILKPIEVSDDHIKAVQHIVLNCSFKGGIGKNKMKSIEGLIVQDADRLDAIGAIGIARTFAFGGKFGNLLYDPEVKPSSFKSEEEYRKKRTHTINHFYEKLLKLKEMMHTKTAKKLAEQRHQYMLDFLDQFYGEWEGRF
ncbi:MAG: HD domain-containing protein [Crocinitomicaceae bacterium]